MKTFNHPLQALRYHVSGAIARGEAKPITEQKPRFIGTKSNGIPMPFPKPY